MKNTTDPLEQLVSTTLDKLGIEYTCPDQDSTYGGRLDFYLTALGVHIECKAWGSPRVHSQIESVSNCVVLIGMKATKLFCDLLEAGGYGR